MRFEELECLIKRGGKEYKIASTTAKSRRSCKWWAALAAQHRHDRALLAGPEVLRLGQVSVPPLKHTLKAKAVLCPGLRITLRTRPQAKKTSGSSRATWAPTWWKSWDNEKLPPEPITSTREGDNDPVSYALVWAPNAEQAFGESYVNLIPTIEGGTHVNGLRSGVRRPCASLRVPQSRAARYQAHSGRHLGEACYVLS